VPRRGRGGDEELRRVYREHVQAVFAYFAHLLPRAAAEDLTSSTFERVVRSWASYDPARASERTWILAVARNLLVDHFRREQHRATLSTDADPGLLAGRADEADPLSRRLSIEELKAWLEPLSEREREAVALRYGADLQAAEVGEIMGLTPANVHQVLSRALRRLRDRSTGGEPPQRQSSTERDTMRER
jgi:RNA polymerase sigma-70 factor (ECF subfamily)